MRTVTWPSPQRSRSTASAVPRTSSTNASCLSQVIAVSKVSRQDAHARRRCRAGRARAGRRRARRPTPPPLASRARPPRDRAAPRSNCVVDVRDLEAEHEQRAVPSPAKVSAASRASMTRQLAGRSPAWTMSRTARRRVVVVGEARRVARAAVARALRCTRTHASVMTPSVPSRAEQQPVGRRAGARAGQPPRLPDARARA